jgi:hypothetical protein
MDLDDKINYLIMKYSKSWLAEQLSISRPTLDVRFEKKNWKKIEVQQILRLT